ncbi:MAG TPA: glycosyltransferase family 4 protein [Terriglobales bacterium]|nr:glycosyltransferase family 4 protein [Terriglobales bacterium]
MRILYISQYFPPEMGAPAARVSELARHWAAAGHDVRVLTGFPNHPTGVLHPEYRSRFWRLVCREQMDGVRVIRSWLMPLPNRKAHERMLNYSSFCFSGCLTGSFVPRPDVVIATSPQLLVGICGWWISRMKNVPFVLEIRDLWPESLAAVGVGSGRSLLHRGLARLAGFLYGACDHLVVVTPAFKEHIAREWGVPAQKISVVPNGVETELFSPGSGGDAVRAELGLQGRFVVSYIGTLGMAHDLGAVLDAAGKCAGSMPNVEFLLVGEGADKERLIVQARERQLPNVRFLPQQPRTRIPALVAASDACLVTLRRSDVFKTVIPSKMLEFMSCGRPIILAVEGQASDLLNSAGAGICIPPQEPASIVNAIQKLMVNPDLCRRLGKNGRRFIEQNLSRSQTSEAYIRVLEPILERNSAHLSATSISSVTDP